MKASFFITVPVVAVLCGTSFGTVVLAEQNAPAALPAEKRDSGAVPEDVKENAKEIWKDIKEGAEEAYDSAKSSVADSEEEDINFSTSSRGDEKSVASMIGTSVLDNNGVKVAVVKDIIFDEYGDATMIVLTDEKFVGTNLRMRAFKYDDIVRQGTGGDAIMPLTQEIINEAPAFSYDREDTAQGVQIMPDKNYSAAALLEADLIDAKNKTVAEVEDISLEDGHADQLFIVFDRILGLGGKKAAFSYGDAKLVREGDEVDFQLSHKQSAKFEAYKSQIGQ